MALLVLSDPLPSAPFVAALRAAAPELRIWSETDALSPTDEAAVEAVLAWRLKPGQLARFPNLRVLCSTGAGVEKLLLPELPPALPVTRVVDPQQAQTMAQYVLAATLHFTRTLPLYQAQQARAEWRRHPVRPQWRVGILGQGAVAQAVARAFAPLGYPVAVWGRQRKVLPGVQGFAGTAELPALLAHSEVLVCTLPLTAATAGLLDRARLSLLPRGAVLINVGRGGHLVEPDLRALLDEGHLAGAALDVFEREPPAPDDWVWQHPRVLATPHIAGEAREAIVAAQTLQALACARAGLAQPHGVDRSAGY